MWSAKLKNIGESFTGMLKEGIYRQTRSVRETTEEKQKSLSRKQRVAEKRGSETGESTATRLKKQR